MLAGVAVPGGLGQSGSAFRSPQDDRRTGSEQRMLGHCFFELEQNTGIALTQWDWRTLLPSGPIEFAYAFLYDNYVQNISLLSLTAGHSYLQ
jgi:hypothetical protein